MNVTQDSLAKKRAHKRYIVTGTAELETGEVRFPGQLVTLGGGGMLVRSEAAPPSGAQVDVDFSITGFPAKSPITATGSVVWTQPGRVGLKFLEDPPGLKTVLAWLERENYAWSGAGAEPAAG